MNKWMNARTLSSVSISDSDTYYMRKRIHWRELQIIMMSNIYGWTVYKCSNSWASGVVLAIENLPVSTGDGRDAVSIPGLGRSPGGGYGNPLQYSCLENHMDRGELQSTVHGVTKSWTWLNQLSTHPPTPPPNPHPHPPPSTHTV